METIHTIEWMKQIANQARAQERILGLVPTMGALHEGHFSLIRAAQRDCAPVVVSLFVNPKQFGPAEDFGKYPRTLERIEPRWKLWAWIISSRRRRRICIRPAFALRSWWKA